MHITIGKVSFVFKPCLAIRYLDFSKINYDIKKTTPIVTQFLTNTYGESKDSPGVIVKQLVLESFCRLKKNSSNYHNFTRIRSS